MAPLLSLAGLVLIAVGLVGLLLPAVPGSPLIVLGIAAIAWADGFARIGAGTLLVVALLGLLSWATDAVAGVLGARTMGASRWGVIGGVVGLLAGLPFGLPGLIAGPAIGAAALEYYKDPDARRAAKAGLGIFIGFVVGTAAKFAIAVTMLGIAAWAYFAN
jgi:uncharacterized protein YqgC (DUF456 family)